MKAFSMSKTLMMNCSGNMTVLQIPVEHRFPFQHFQNHSSGISEIIQVLFCRIKMEPIGSAGLVYTIMILKQAKPVNTGITMKMFFQYTPINAIIYGLAILQVLF